jgi:hypothetical protein
MVRFFYRYFAFATLTLAGVLPGCSSDNGDALDARESSLATEQPRAFTCTVSGPQLFAKNTATLGRRASGGNQATLMEQYETPAEQAPRRFGAQDDMSPGITFGSEFRVAPFTRPFKVIFGYLQPSIASNITEDIAYEVATRTSFTRFQFRISDLIKPEGMSTSVVAPVVYGTEIRDVPVTIHCSANTDN